MARTDRICTRCGTPFSSEKLGELCPACLIANTLDIEEPSDGPAFWEDSPPKPTKPTRTFSHFELLDELGRGGMGVVYRARDLNTERIIALKVLQAHHLEVEDLVQRFRSEVRAVGSLDHPHVLPIHEVGEYEGIPFFSMKLTTGGSLAQNIGRFLGNPKEAADLLAKVCRGVQHAHERGILHRDLKPGNILLDSAGEPFVCDFGLAKWLEDDRQLTMTAAVLGTPHYIAPEQASGSKGLTTAVDIYSLGAILYELLTGRPPFVGGSVLETLVASQEKTPDRPSSLVKNVPRDLETVCLKALQHDPSNRYTTAGAFAEDLENWLAGKPILARPVGAAEQLWRWAKRNPLPALLVAFLIFTLIATSVGATYAAASFDQQRKRALAAETNATERLHQSLIAQARAALVTGRNGQRVETIAALSQAAQIKPTPELRNDAIAALSLLDLSIERVWNVRERTRVQPIFDDHLQFILTEQKPGELLLLNTADDSVRARVPIDDSHGTVEALCLHGLKYVGVRFNNRTCAVYDLENGTKVFETGLTARGGTRPWENSDICFDRNGTHLFAPDSDGIAKFDFRAGKKVEVISLGKPASSLSLSPDGRHLAACRSDDTGVVIWDLERRKLKLNVPTPLAANHVAWAPNGQSLAIACKDFNIHIANTQSGKIARSFNGHRQEVTRVTYSNSGALLASTSRDSSLRIWSTQSNYQEVLIPGFGGMPVLQFSRDDQRLGTGTGDTRACIFNIHGIPRVCETYSPQKAVQRAMLVGSVDYSPDGKWLASVSFEAVEIIDRHSPNTRSAHVIDENAYKAARFIDPNTLLVSSEKSAITEYRVVQENGEVHLRKIRPYDGTKGFLLGSNTGRRDPQKIVCFSRPGGDVVILDTKSGGFTKIATGLPEVKDAILDASTNRVFITHFDLNDRSATDTQIWSATGTGKISSIPSGPSSRLAISPNGRWIATTSIHGSMIWDAGTLKLVRHYPDFGYAPEFSSDSLMLAVSESEKIIVIETQKFDIVAELHPPLYPSIDHRLQFSPDSQSLAAQGADCTLGIWNIRSLQAQLQQLGLNWN